jgi:hypothetical protein
MELIRFKPYDLEKQRILQPGVCELVLFDSHILYTISFLCEEPNVEDKELPWIERKENLTSYVKRDLISSIDFYYVQISDVWQIQIEVNGRAYPLNVFYRSETKGREIFQKLINYAFNGHTN